MRALWNTQCAIRAGLSSSVDSSLSLTAAVSAVSAVRTLKCQRNFPKLQRGQQSQPLIPPPVTLSQHSRRWFGQQWMQHSGHDNSIGTESTIFALSTPPGKSAIAVVRISGPACLDIYRTLCPSKPLVKPRRAALRTIYKPTAGTGEKPEILDPGALVLYFPGPTSTTGEDILELHLHGGPAIIRAVLTAIPTCPTITSSIRYAEPGEFTRRAFLNDRLSLPQIEALGDTLSANTEQQRKLSLAGGRLAALYENWRRQLVEARGELEALIDFSEDQQFETTPVKLLSGVTREARRLRDAMGKFIQNAVKGELLREGISISLVGAPNVGKSSLLNRIVGREAVIVSHKAGTTRDVVDLSVDLGGYVMIVGDTAGLRTGDVGGNVKGENVEEIEKEGIRRARKRVMDGDVVVVVLAVGVSPETGEVELPIPEEVIELVKEARAIMPPKEILVAVNKLDLLSPASGGELPPIPRQFREKIMSVFPDLPPNRIQGIACYPSKGDMTSSIASSDSTGNIQPLLTSLTTLFKGMTSPMGISDTFLQDEEGAFTSLAANTRQRLLVESCISYLDRYLASVDASNCNLEDHGDGEVNGNVDVVIAAEELRSAAECLARVTGRGEGAGDVEEVLGVVFERFCVGK